MADYDSPFQMDEDLGSPNRSLETDLSHSRINESSPSGPPVKLEGQAAQGQPRTLDTLPAHNSQRNGTEALRSRLQRIKIEEGVGTTTEEDEWTFEEDADDKFDKEAAEKARVEYIKAAELISQPLTPPENFAPVINNIYRSSFPQQPNFSFLKTLKLKSVLCLIPEEYPKSHEEFFEEEGIQLFHLGMAGNKEPFVIISSELITEAIKIVINPANQPILIHCNRGKHRTGCLVGVLRRLQKWSLTIIFDEYRKFAAPKERPMDQQFIELYDENRILHYAQDNGLLPLQWD
ncbi:hypothetical protein FT663_04501 [Candidozyma haemuli var. vulneris]|uniref:diphosphoinositol-polyphosphate diphosphatase n=1 Tax=Candidozyma haemuli TaxID=45357 RepID=A0A2V1AY96_9ASCO|nr:hypothetical protein CXQ85_002562 [[Candida] haemuloni]KAF3986084.1 hypothetical protein FT662_04781 [[Candida] haemuloni var. vulneris]KAF3987349.1 hypothetical protein FT663_04501 [[Candida] haemuloni var. vulneris]PVH22838.1 hypothetical protein CXQ85_002562 [[Candida] haemuloni]